MTESAQRGRIIEVPCTVEIEQTSETLHAHVELEGIEIGPGDTVRVHDAPVFVEFGGRIVCQRRATVVRATWLDRLRAKVEGYMELTELYEVGFSEGRPS